MLVESWTWQSYENRQVSQTGIKSRAQQRDDLFGKDDKQAQDGDEREGKVRMKGHPAPLGHSEAKHQDPA